jgi:glycine hydroxymethyltransferase
MSEIIIISAIAPNGVIGKGSEIPWYIKEDFKRFKELTRGHAVIMGSVTFESLPIRPLPNRFNVVLNFDKDYTAPGALVTTSFEEALEACKHYDKIFIIGGASVYKLGLKVANKLELTKVKQDYAGDVFFPEIDYSKWKLTKSEDHKDYTFETYIKENTSSVGITNDIEVREIIKDELQRQKETINMIPSENYCSKDVLAACGSVLNNKYAEGYPNKRYYQGNSNIDNIELLAIERAKKLFNAEHVNVQPNSGSPANMAVYFAMLKRGDKILGMDLSHGGHLTHGSKVNFSGKTYDFISYEVDPLTNLIDMEKVREIALKEKPKMIVCGSTAYPREINFKEFATIAKEVGAYCLADISHIAGLVGAGVHPSPFPYADFVTTTTHKTLRGPRSAIIMCKKEYAKEIDKAVFPGLQGGPHEHTIAAKAVCFKEALQPEFKEYAKQIVKNAKVLADTLRSRKIALASEGSDTHLLLIDLIRTQTIKELGKGKEVAIALEEAGIVTNANTIPFDPSTPFKPSGIRLGTPILTTMGMKEPEMVIVGNYIADVINHMSNKEIRKQIRQEVKELTKKFKFY